MKIKSSSFRIFTYKVSQNTFFYTCLSDAKTNLLYNSELNEIKTTTKYEL